MLEIKHLAQENKILVLVGSPTPYYINNPFQLLDICHKPQATLEFMQKTIILLSVKRAFNKTPTTKLTECPQLGVDMTITH